MALERGFSVLAIDSHTGSDRWLARNKKEPITMWLFLLLVLGRSIRPGEVGRRPKY
jgi:hypothetical protein